MVDIQKKEKLTTYNFVFWHILITQLLFNQADINILR